MNGRDLVNFYDVISELNINLENRMFTVCDGDHAGEKMIVSAGEPVWISKEGGFFSVHASDAVSVKDGCLAVIDGERVFAELLGNEKKIVICGARIRHSAAHSTEKFTIGVLPFWTFTRLRYSF